MSRKLRNQLWVQHRQKLLLLHKVLTTFSTKRREDFTNIYQWVFCFAAGMASQLNLG